MANYTLSTEKKEDYKIQYSDLAPSLQELLDSKVDKELLTKMSTDIEAFKTKYNEMVVTEGSSFPSNPTNSKNMHLNTSNRMVYAYIGSAWKPVCMIPNN